MEPLTWAVFARLLLVLGPGAIDLVHEIVSKWNQPMSNDDVQRACSVARMSPQELNAEARAKLAALGQLPVETQSAAEKRLDKAEGAQT